MGLFDPKTFSVFLQIMTGIAVIVFFALFFVDAGYGIMYNKKWKVTVNNRLGWILMEAPVFVVMLLSWLFSDRKFEVVRLIFFLLFQCHYFQRSFIFPMLFKTKSRMPILIMLSGVTFNMMNGLMQGGWIFYVSPADLYTSNWLYSPQFIIGVIMFFIGMGINLHSDYIIRHLRKPGDHNHYLPKGGFYDYVTSANYFGELIEWLGWAILTWSWAGLVFFIWSFANLVPRANTIYKKYQKMFPEMENLKLKRVIPFIY
uniref:3-oxo-5-alpha-steroid 4-dehydrogenase 1 n=1 Tax=Caecomyces sp. TaxID=2078661 RepID=A0A2S1TZ40_9FUNG|nr:methylene-fatty-acyl-phospholipid synthase [Caecomyces sp.]